MRRHTFLPLLLAASLLLTAACSRTKVRSLVRQVAELSVDTTGYEHRQLAVAPFTAVDIDCMADVSYESSPTPQVTLSAPHEVLANLTARVEGDTLQLSLRHHYRLPSEVVPVIKVKAPQVCSFSLYGCKCLRLGRLRTNVPLQLQLYGVGYIRADLLQAPSLSISLDGAGSISLKDIRTDRLSASISGTGEITLAGAARATTVKVNGAGVVDLSEMHLQEKPDIRTNGNGTVNL